MLQQVGRMVDIDGTLIPAVNIQVDDVPRFFEHDDGSKVWYDVYFEIMFEDGGLWIVEQWIDDEGLTIYVAYYPRWGMGETGDPSGALLFSSWLSFVEGYKARLDSIILKREFDDSAFPY